MKILIWLVIGFAAYTWVMRFKARLSAGSRPAGPSARAPAARVEAMLRCQRCGVHFPASEAQFDIAGTPFCSEEHRRS